VQEQIEAGGTIQSVLLGEAERVDVKELPVIQRAQPLAKALH
jgi:hypothetical protein